MGKGQYSSVIRRQFFDTMAVMTMVELANALSSMVDGMMAGRLLGAVELAAFGIADPYYTIAAVISGVLMVSCQTMCARSIGSGRIDEASHIFSISCILGVVLSGLLTAAGIVFAAPIARLFGARGASAELLPYAKSYLTGLFLGTPGLVLLAVISPVVQLDGGKRRAALASCVVAAVNVVADVLFMVVFKMGLFGLGLGTTVSRFAALVVLLTHFRKKDRLLSFRIRGLKWSLAPEIISGGLPRGANMVCRTIGPIAINSIVLGAAATAGLTALSVQANLRTLLRSPIIGTCSALMLMVGIYAGEQDLDGLKKTFGITLRYVVFLVGSIAVAVTALAPLIARFYLPEEPGVRGMATAAVRWYALSLPLMALNMGVGNYLTAIGNMRGAYLVNIGNELVSLVVCAFLLGKAFGIGGVWAAYTVSQAVTLAVFVAWGMLRRKTQAKGLEKLMFLPDGFGVPEEDCISVFVTSMEEVVGLSQKIGDFCAAHGVDRRRSYFASLCVEEMAGNTVEYGFADGKKHSIDIRVILREGGRASAAAGRLPPVRPEGEGEKLDAGPGASGGERRHPHGAGPVQGRAVYQHHEYEQPSHHHLKRCEQKPVWSSIPAFACQPFRFDLPVTGCTIYLALTSGSVYDGGAIKTEPLEKREWAECCPAFPAAEEREYGGRIHRVLSLL